MKKVRVGMSAIILGLLLLLVFQNQTFFMSKQSLGVNFYFIRFETPLIPNLLILISCFLAGLVVSFYSNFSNKLKYGKIIKLLRSREESLVKLVSSLRHDLDEIKTLSQEKKSDSSFRVE